MKQQCGLRTHLRMELCGIFFIVFFYNKTTKLWAVRTLPCRIFFFFSDFALNFIAKRQKNKQTFVSQQFLS